MQTVVAVVVVVFFSNSVLETSSRLGYLNPELLLELFSQGSEHRKGSIGQRRSVVSFLL